MTSSNYCYLNEGSDGTLNTLKENNIEFIIK